MTLLRLIRFERVKIGRSETAIMISTTGLLLSALSSLYYKVSGIMYTGAIYRGELTY